MISKPHASSAIKSVDEAINRVARVIEANPSMSAVRELAKLETAKSILESIDAPEVPDDD